MGNAKSTTSDKRTPEDLWWNVTETKNKTENTSQIVVKSDSNTERSERKKQLNKELDEFKKDLHTKHEEGRRIIAERKQELNYLRLQLKLKTMINEELREQLEENPNNPGASDTTTSKCNRIEELLNENEEQRKLIEEMKIKLEAYSEIKAKNQELRVNVATLQEDLQNINAEVLNFESERNEYQTHVTALKDVIKVSKEMLNIRENQIQELKHKISVIETTLADREAPLLAQDLRREYERQLRNIRNLRALYEERERVDRNEKQNMASLLEDTKKLLQNEENKNAEQQQRIEELENENSKKYDTINNLQSQLGFSKAEYKELQAEMAVINQLFSQILLGFNNSQDVDLEKLIKLLEENHDLLSKIAIDEESTEISAALPKTLLDLVNQMNEKKENVEKSGEKLQINKLETIVEETESQTQSFQLSSAEEIVQNLPKVWRVLIELLSHQCVPSNTIHEGSSIGNEHFCYKSVQTPTGPKLVLSVSKTFIRLKDLILEKKSLEKETSHLKHLNTHLETRLQDQEKRLQTVSKELSKTWHVVGKMQKQHQQLHTQEKILRYELAQKRKLLNELKEELEYCREKWIQAREKNTSTEIQWKQLRKEFTSRKPIIDASVESGYSDDKSSSDDELSEDNNDKRKDLQNDSRTPHKITVVSENSSALQLIADKNNEATVDDNSEIVNLGNTIDETEETTPATTENCILDVVKCAIADIVENVDSTNDVNHSVPNTEKTDLVQSNERQKVDSPMPSTSNQTNINIEEMLARREERLKRMEEQGKELVKQVTNTSKKSVDICNKLGNLHEIYGENSGATENSTNVSDENITHSDAEETLQDTINEEGNK